MANGPGQTTVGQVSAALDAMAPPALAQSWDNVGLLAGDREAACGRVLLCIDLTDRVLAEAIDSGAQLIITYHPPILKPISRLVAQSTECDALVHRAIASGIAIYSPHTALDAAPGGTNDVMAEFCGLRDVQPFEYVGPSAKQYKLVTFVPPAELETLAAALFEAGAGRIGEYEQCSFRIPGRGTFYGSSSTDPQVGERERLETVDEIRIETVVPERRLPEVVGALRAHHPYEEPAFDLYPLEAEPTAGIGRVGTLPENTTLAALVETLTSATGTRVATYVGARETAVSRAAVCVGSAGRLPFERWRSATADVIVTGEIRHHDALAILRRGKCAIALGHWESERPVLPRLADRLTAKLQDSHVVVSESDSGPFNRS